MAARERLRRQQEELEVMRTQFLQQGEQHSIGKQLSEVKSEVNRCVGGQDHHNQKMQ